MCLSYPASPKLDQSDSSLVHVQVKQVSETILVRTLQVAARQRVLDRCSLISCRSCRVAASECRSDSTSEFSNVGGRAAFQLLNRGRL